MLQRSLLSVFLCLCLIGSQAPAKSKTKAADKAPPAPAVPTYNLQQLQKLLYNKQYQVPKPVADHALKVLACTQHTQLGHRPVLTIIDYSQPSTNKRLWVFDLQNKKLLHYTRVTHGIKSGERYTQTFSNRHNSKSSSMGVYLTGKSYHGRYGHSLKLQGLEPGFNDNAYNRFIVMHGSWYANPDFVKKYQRTGRSWGCPSLSRKKITPVINAIKDQSLLVAYSGDQRWQHQSKYLNCHYKKIKRGIMAAKAPKPEVIRARDNVLILDRNGNGRRERNDPIVTLEAKQYTDVYQQPCPLKRMLRRQIKGTEYIALSPLEVKYIATKHPDKVKHIRLMMPVVKKLRGYYATEFVNETPKGELSLESPKPDQWQLSTAKGEKYPLTAYQHDIRWLGL